MQRINEIDKEQLYTTTGYDAWMISSLRNGYHEGERVVFYRMRNIRTNYFRSGMMGHGELKDFIYLIPEPVYINRAETQEEKDAKTATALIAFTQMNEEDRTKIFKLVADRFILNRDTIIPKGSKG